MTNEKGKKSGKKQYLGPDKILWRNGIREK